MASGICDPLAGRSPFAESRPPGEERFMDGIAMIEESKWRIRILIEFNRLYRRRLEVSAAVNIGIAPTTVGIEAGQRKAWFRDAAREKRTRIMKKPERDA